MTILFVGMESSSFTFRFTLSISSFRLSSCFLLSMPQISLWNSLMSICRLVRISWSCGQNRLIKGKVQKWEFISKTQIKGWWWWWGFGGWGWRVCTWKQSSGWGFQMAVCVCVCVCVCVVWCGVVWCGVVWCGVGWGGVCVCVCVCVWCGVVWCGVGWGGGGWGGVGCVCV